jgi:hypothetical protein
VRANEEITQKLVFCGSSRQLNRSNLAVVR